MSKPRFPKSYGILLYPGFGVLDVAGPLEVLNSLCRHDGQEDMTLSIVSRTMDPVSPTAPDGKGAGVTSSQRWLPTHTFEKAPPLDFLLVPGGWGSFPPADTTAEVDFVRKVYRGDGCQPLQYLFTVCTGAGLAAEAGILDGHSATTNKVVFNQVAAYGPKTHWIGHARWVVSDNIWTTSGVSAGTDGMIAWMASLFPNEVVEEVVNQGMEYNREKDASNDPFAKINNVKDIPPVGQ